MLKKFLVLTVLLMIVTLPVSAARLELAEEPIGKISVWMDGTALEVENPIEIDGIGDGHYYSQAVALFGEKSSEKIYYHFNAPKNISRFGAEDIGNTIPVLVLYNCEIYPLKDDAGHNLFLLNLESGSGREFIVVGQNGNTWREYINLPKLREKFDVGCNFTMEKFFVEGNKIIARYQLQDNYIDIVNTWDVKKQKFSAQVVKH
ncbi:MAG: hypothetical protein K6G55_02285 [Selenomonadaceae bacterium]|nr:hypothetical protein [Selenomonadaceae bacterium]